MTSPPRSRAPKPAFRTATKASVSPARTAFKAAALLAALDPHYTALLNTVHLLQHEAHNGANPDAIAPLALRLLAGESAYGEGI